MGQTRRLAEQLRALGEVQAPSTLAERVLVEVGLVDVYWPLDTPIGPVFVAWNERGISTLRQATDAEAFERAFLARFGRPARRAERPPARLLASVLGELRGTRRSRLRFDLGALGPFQRAVLEKALEIPRGEVRQYGWIAREIGSPMAVRAVGTALANNPIPLLIPCHRVVRANGRIGNYAFGSAAKRELLRLEGVEPDALERLAQRRVR